MSDERCGPWVYASTRRRSRECRRWNLTNEQLAARRQAEATPQRSLAEIRSDVAAYLGQYIDDQVFGMPVRIDPTMPADEVRIAAWWYRPERIAALHNEQLAEAMREAFRAESTDQPRVRRLISPAAEHVDITHDINDRARKLIESALRKEQEP